MGINSSDGSLYWATGIDNSGLVSDKQKTVGIIRSLSRQVSGFDVFAGLGVSASIAFTKIAKDAKKMAEEYELAMKEVQTISAAVQKDYEGFSEQIVGLSTTLPQSATELSKAYYQIVSAGYDGESGLTLLEASAKGAVGGVTDVTTAADAMTTVLNAWKINASESSRVADVFFNTVKLGKTTFGELGGSINQVAALSAAMGISFEEVMAATASLTKQGAPTAMAMTQIRQAIIALSENLGDGWSETYTLQEALVKLREAAGGSDKKLKDMVGRIEGVNAVLGLTGSNAQMAADDLASYSDAAGSAGSAFGTMMESSVNQSQKLQNNIDAALKPIGDFMSGKSTDFAKFMNEAFESGKVEQWAGQTAKALTMLAAFTAGLKGAAVAQGALTAATAAGNKVMNLLFSTISKNPVGILIGSLAALGVAMYKAKDSADETSKEFTKFMTNIGSESREMDGLFDILKKTEKGTDAHKAAIERINSKYGEYLPKLLSEKDALKEVENAHKAAKDAMIARIAETTKATALEDVYSNTIKKQAQLSSELYKKLKEDVGTEGAQIAAKNIQALGKEFAKLYSEYDKLMQEQDTGAAKQVYNKIQDMVSKFNEEFAGGDEYNLIWDLAAKIAVEEGNLTAKKQEIESMYAGFVEDVNVPPPELKIDNTEVKTGGAEKSGIDNYYEHLQQQIDLTEEKLKSLAGAEGKMNEASIDATKKQLQAYRDEKTALDELLGLTQKVAEKTEDIQIAPEGSIKGLEEEIDRLNDRYEEATTDAMRGYLKSLITSKEEELKVIKGIKDEEIKLEENFYDKIQTYSFKNLKEELKRLDALKKSKEAAFSQPGLSSSDKKKLKSDIEEINDQIKGVNGTIEQDTQNAISAVSTAFNGLGNIISGIDSEMGAMVNSIGSIGTGIGQILTSGGNPTQALSGAVSVIEGLIGIFSDDDGFTNSFSENLEKINRLIEEQSRLIDIASRKGGQTDALKEEIDLRKKAVNETKAQYESYLDFMKQSRKDAKAQMSDDMYSSMIKAQEKQLDEFMNQWEDAQFELQQAEQELTDFGSGFLTEVDLADKIAQAFEDGKTSVEDFADYTNELLKEAVLESFKAQILGPAITKAQEYLSAAMEDGKLGEDEVKEFQGMMTGLVSEFEPIWAGLTEALPQVFGAISDNTNSLTGAISSSLTEETGSLLAGRINTMLMDLREIKEINTASMNHLSAIEQNTSYNRELTGIKQELTEIKNSLINA